MRYVISPARQAAFSILQRVETGGYASDLLLARSARLDSRDAGLASEIVFGSIRRQAQLDHIITMLAKRPAAKLDEVVRIALRMGVYQTRHLDRVPAHAIVHDTVELVKLARKRSAVGFANAIMRRVPTGEVAWPERSVALSMPEWLLAGWDAQWGPGMSASIAQAFLEPPETWVRNPEPREGLILEPAGLEGAFRVLSGNTEGLRIQDIGSQSIVPLLDLEPGQTFLDLCSAPGNKTAQALEWGVIGVACDIHLHRLKTVAGCPRVVLDAEQPLPFSRGFDRILIDAPCSGTGTLARNPEIRWRIQPSDVKQLHEKQVNILRRGLGHLNPDGRLVYSTCSLETLENEAVVDRVLSESFGRFHVLKMLRRTPGLDPGDGFFAAQIAKRAP
jgi:16S rRNA (cytosine967-C5)-methyltransferase